MHTWFPLVFDFVFCTSDVLVGIDLFLRSKLCVESAVVRLCYRSKVWELELMSPELGWRVRSFGRYGLSGFTKFQAPLTSTSLFPLLLDHHLHISTYPHCFVCTFVQDRISNLDTYLQSI